MTPSRRRVVGSKSIRQTMWEFKICRYFHHDNTTDIHLSVHQPPTRGFIFIKHYLNIHFRSVRYLSRMRWTDVGRYFYNIAILLVCCSSYSECVIRAVYQNLLLCNSKPALPFPSSLIPLLPENREWSIKTPSKLGKVAMCGRRAANQGRNITEDLVNCSCCSITFGSLTLWKQSGEIWSKDEAIK